MSIRSGRLYGGQSPLLVIRDTTCYANHSTTVNSTTLGPQHHRRHHAGTFRRLRVDRFLFLTPAGRRSLQEQPIRREGRGFDSVNFSEFGDCDKDQLSTNEAIPLQQQQKQPRDDNGKDTRHPQTEYNGIK